MKKRAVSILAVTLLLLAPVTPALAAPTISYSAPNVTALSPLTLQGSGFQAGEVVFLSLGLSTSSVTADPDGSFSGAVLMVPNLPSGLYYLVAVGLTSGLPAFTSVWINSFYPLASPSSWYINPGSTLTWSGSGFAPNEQITLRDASSTVIAQWNTSGSGTFSAEGASMIPYALRNSTTVFTIDSSISGVHASYPITVADLYPWANPFTWYAAPGTNVTFEGGGFGANEGISVYLGASTTPLAHGTADGLGMFSMVGPTPLPFASEIGGALAAPYQIVGDQSGMSVGAPVTLASFYPLLSPSAYYSAPGGFISLIGSGFAANETVNLMVASTSTSTLTDNTGGFILSSLQMPATPNSLATITATGTLSGASSNVSIAIGPYYPSVTPSLWYGFPGDTVLFSGSGFAPNETITVSGASSATTTTDSTGSFSGVTAILPAGSSAAYTFLGAQSATPFELLITLGMRTSAIWFDNYWGQGGTPLTVFGAGFGNNETVTLTHDSNFLASVNADSSGNFTASTSIPFAPPGNATINAWGESTHSSVSADLTVAPVYTNLTLGSYVVTRGTAVNFIGSGYLPSEPIEIRTDRTGTSTVATFSSDSSGSFNDSSYVIPADWASGNLILMVKGTHSFDEKDITIWVSE